MLRNQMTAPRSPRAVGRRLYQGRMTALMVAHRLHGRGNEMQLTPTLSHRSADGSSADRKACIRKRSRLPAPPDMRSGFVIERPDRFRQSSKLHGQAETHVEAKRPTAIAAPLAFPIASWSMSALHGARNPSGLTCNARWTSGSFAGIEPFDPRQTCTASDFTAAGGVILRIAIDGEPQS